MKTYLKVCFCIWALHRLPVESSVWEEGRWWTRRRRVIILRVCVYVYMYEWMSVCVCVCVCVFTAARAVPRTWPGCSWCVPALSSGRPPPASEPSSPSPGSRLGWRSGSPWAASRPGTAWPPSCSSCAWPSICHPAQRTQGRERGDVKKRFQGSLTEVFITRRMDVVRLSCADRRRAGL